MANFRQSLEFAEFTKFTQFEQDPKLGWSWTFLRENLVFHWRKISYFITWRSEKIENFAFRWTSFPKNETHTFCPSVTFDPSIILDLTI